MALDKRVAFCVGAMVMLCLGRASIAQVPRIPLLGSEREADMRTLLDELRSTFPSNRSDKVQAIVERGKQVPQDVSIVINDVAANLYETDSSYVANCIVALAMLKAPAATDVLIEAMDAPAAQIGYLAAWALGEIWQDASPPADQLQRINGALMGAIYGASYAEEPAGCYGPGVALARINKISNNGSGSSEELLRAFENLSPEQLRQTVDAWAGRNPGKLPALQDQPWEMLLDLVLHGSDQGRILVREKPLGAVDAIVSFLRKDNTEVPEAIRRELGTILAGITGVEFRSGSGSRSEDVDAWMEHWTDSLKERTDEPARAYVLREYERATRECRVYTNMAIAKRAQLFKDVLLSILNSTDDIPKRVSRATRSLLEAGLRLKQTLVEHLDALNRADMPVEKQEHINAMKAAVEAIVWKRNPDGSLVEDREAMALRKEIARRFVPSLVDFARKEQHAGVLGRMALLLEAITDLPCSLVSTTDEGRNRAVDQWLEALKEKEHPSESPDSLGNP